MHVEKAKGQEEAVLYADADAMLFSLITNKIDAVDVSISHSMGDDIYPKSHKCKLRLVMQTLGGYCCQQGRAASTA